MSAVAAPQHQAFESSLVSKLCSYSLVETAVGYYQAVKKTSPIVTSSFNMAESVALRGIEVSIPIVKKVDEYTHIDERGTALLTNIESKVKVATEVAMNPLDSVLDALEAIAPTNLSQQDLSDIAAGKSPRDSPKMLTTVKKVRYIGTRISDVSIRKLREYQLQGPVHQEIGVAVADLIKYSVHVLHLDEVGDSLAHRVHDSQQALFKTAAYAATNAQELINKSPFLSALEHSIEPYLANCKTAGEKAVVRIIAAVSAGVDLTNQFFDKSVKGINEVISTTVERTRLFVEKLQKEHPQLQQALSGIVSSVYKVAVSGYHLASDFTAARAHNAVQLYNALFDVLEQMEAQLRQFLDKIASNQHMLNAPQTYKEAVVFGSSK